MRSRPDDLWLEVGRLTKPHGLHGAFQYKSYSGSLDALISGEVVRLKRRDERVLDVTLREIRPFKQGAIVTLDTDTDILPETLRGAVMLVQRADLPPLETGEVFISDLLGLTAQLPDGKIAGTVRDAVDTGPFTSLIIDGDHSGAIPFQAEWVDEPDFAAGTITLRRKPIA